MKVIALKGEPRVSTGKALSKQLRKEGKVPCVVYGSGENQHFSVYQADFKNLVYTPNTYLVRLDLGQTAKLAKVQEIQYNPVSEDILHADFFEVNPEKPVKVPIPIKVVGNSPGVRGGGKLQVKIKKLNVSGLITDLPEYIEINIDKLDVGKSIKVKDISVNKLTLLDSGSNSILSCIVTRAAKSAGIEEEAAAESTPTDAAAETETTEEKE